MKLPLHILQGAKGAGVLAIGLMMVQRSVAAPPTAGTTEAAKSAFLMPANPNEGRDPFFPNSLRPYETAIVNSPTAALSDLVLKGFSGRPGHRLVIINDQTFAAGDVGDITTPSGKIQVHCIAIGADSVVIEAGGQRAVLTFKESP